MRYSPKRFLAQYLLKKLHKASSSSQHADRSTCLNVQLSLAIPSWLGAMSSTSQRAVTPCGWGVKAGVWFMCGWQVKLCDPLATHRPYLSALEIKGL